MTMPPTAVDLERLTGPIPIPARRRIARRIGIIAFGVIAAITAIALVAAGFVVWTVQRSFPQTAGTLEVSGLKAEVSISRDELGIPTIVADTTDDLFFAQGFVHAQDRFWEMDFRRHVTSGRLSELFGESQLPTDIFLRTLGWRTIAEQEVEMLDAQTRSYYEAYAEGVNAYLDQRSGAELSLEYAVLGLQNPDYEVEPWSAADSVAWLKAMAWDLRGNIEEEIERALLAQTLSAEQIAELYPAYPFDEHPVIVPEISAGFAVPASPPLRDADTVTTTAAIAWDEVGAVVTAASALLGGVGEGIGSNSWAVAGSLTESGMPLLSNDPHLGASLPSVWHQVGLRCAVVSAACPFDVAGFGFSGVPGVIIGHNADIAWGFTNLTADVTDLYLEKVDGDAYWYDGERMPFTERREVFRVAGGDDVEKTVRSTVHGPILSDVNGDIGQIAADPYGGSTDAVIPAPAGAPEGEWAVSLRWTALEPGTTAAAIFALNTARDFEQFRAAAAQFDVPAQNLLYADTEGNIGYQTPGKLPIRGAEDGTMPQPGWNSRYDWRGYIPFEELPVVYNPPSGYIVTANNAVIGTEYEHFLGSDFDYGWRAARITDLIERTAALRKLTADDMTAFQADQEFWMGKRLVSVYGEIIVDDEQVAEALRLLESWNAQNDAGSAAAAYANVLWDELAQNMFARRAEPAPLSSQSRMFLVVDALLDDRSSPWWTNEQIDVDGRDDMLARSAEDAYARLVSLQGANPTGWNWGDLHAITLRSDTFGGSGIALIEWLFNRGPYPVGGGASVVDATGWPLGSGSFATTTVPSMRMTVDLADLDASRWNHLTGTSGHAFHPHYIDQTQAWQQRRQTPWVFSIEKITENAVDTLVLRPAS